MSTRIASGHADHRRGLVLGLTMAEVLLLLLFVLLLALTDRVRHLMSEVQNESSRAQKSEERLAAIEPALAILGDHGVDIQVLSERLAASEEQQRRLDEAQERAEGLQARLSEMEPKARQWEDIASAARRVNPDAAPAATLRLALQKVAPTEKPLAEAVERSEMLARLEALAQSVEPTGPPAQTLEKALVAFKKGTQLKGVVVAVRDREQELAKQLKAEFGKDLGRWDATLDDSKLIIQFANPELLFEAGSDQLSRHFEKVLADFFPRYLARLSEFRSDIDEVRIEGHTSSEWRGATTENDNYFRNMALSQDRTRAVLEYGMTRTGLSSSAQDWARSLVTANGLAWSRLRRRPDGSEDAEASRRVEFRVLMKLREQVMGAVDGN